MEKNTKIETPKPLDDGQEGRGRTKEEVLNSIINYDNQKMLLSDAVRTISHNGISYSMVRYELVLEAMEQYAALPVADGEGEKVGSLIDFVANIRDYQCLDGEDIPDPLRLQAKELLESLPSAVTGGVKEYDRIIKNIYEDGFYPNSPVWHMEVVFSKSQWEKISNYYHENNLMGIASEGQPAQGKE